MNGKMKKTAILILILLLTTALYTNSLAATIFDPTVGRMTHEEYLAAYGMNEAEYQLYRTICDIQDASFETYAFTPVDPVTNESIFTDDIGSNVILKRSTPLYSEPNKKSKKLATVKKVDYSYRILNIITDKNGEPTWYKIYYQPEGRDFGLPPDEFMSYASMSLGSGWITAKDAALTDRTGVMKESVRAKGRTFTNMQIDPVPKDMRGYFGSVEYIGKPGEYYQVSNLPRSTSDGTYIFWAAVPASKILFDPISGYASQEAESIPLYQTYTMSNLK